MTKELRKADNQREKRFRGADCRSRPDLHTLSRRFLSSSELEQAHSMLAQYQRGL